MSAAALSCRLTDQFAASCAVLDESAQTLFLTEMFRGLGYTLKSFFDPKVTVSSLLPLSACTMSVGHLYAALRCTGFEVFSAVNLFTSWLRSRACTESMHGRLTSAHLPARRSTTPLRRGHSARGSGGSTCCGAIPPARSVASPASCARRWVSCSHYVHGGCSCCVHMDPVAARIRRHRR